MAGSALCFIFLASVVAINQSLAFYNFLNLDFGKLLADYEAVMSMAHPIAQWDTDNSTYKDRKGRSYWIIQIENGQRKYRVKKGASITWTVLFKNVRPTEKIYCWWFWPNEDFIDPKLMPGETEIFGDRLMRKRHFTLSNVTISGTYEIFVSKNLENFANLELEVSVESKALYWQGFTGGTSSSRIGLKSYFLAFVATCFACRSVAFGTTE